MEEFGPFQAYVYCKNVRFLTLFLHFEANDWRAKKSDPDLVDPQFDFKIQFLPSKMSIWSIEITLNAKKNFLKFWVSFFFSFFPFKMSLFELQKSISKLYIILLQSNHPHLLSLITASHKSHFHFLFSNVRLSLSSFDNPSAKMAVQSKTN